ncbi:MAG: metal ABC transporter ATP-binding protein [Chloroflexi bacterium]|nr:metal ABC transporter ATP-binding protein [Chloroflexota bacterium]
MSEPLLVVDSVTFGYSDEPAVCDVSLEVCSGEFLALVGPNGSGKSTLLKLAVGLARPWKGRVSLFGAPVERRHQRYRLGYVPQQAAALHRDFPATVEEVVLSGRSARLGLFRRPGRADGERARAALDSVGLLDRRSSLIGELSGGQRQRVMLARALVGEPELLLLDEPTTGLDEASRARFLDLLANARAERGLTVVYVAHDLPTLRPYVSSVALLNQELLYHGVPDGLVRHVELLRLLHPLADHGSEGGGHVR